ncbi:MAG: cytochrome c3 family protein [Deltaproteobacteria bacterium]
MKALIVVVLAALAAVACGETRTTAIGFDHTVHARNVDVSGASPIACTRCHEQKAGRLIGKPGHAACFGTCHGAAPTGVKRGAKLAIGEDRLKLCTNCHAEAALVAPSTGTLAVPYPPYRIDRDFNLALSHAKHRDVTCTQCHDLSSTKPPAPHARCAGCHDGKAKAFAMTTCETCHPPAVGKPQPPELKAVQNTVTAIFSHATHAARGGAGKDCATCHAKIRESDASELPRPTAGDCAHCHDGKQAFSVTASCTKCHAAPADAFLVDRPETRFRHDASHAALLASEPCTTCHVLDAKTGEVHIADHSACTQCHAEDFGLRHPKKCGACHNATEPWRHLRADRPLPDSTEFGASLDHAKHTGACTSCHSLRTPTTQLRSPRGHAACLGNGCHAASGGAAPQLVNCAACHRLGLAAERLAKRIADPWSVRLGFTHAAHQNAACKDCHTALVGPLVTLATPAKATCAPCHDGTRAFKLTGTTCRRCHTGGVR